MGYYIDLNTITIDTYTTKLKTAYLPPSRKVLRENLDERFKYFKSLGIKSVQDLLQLLKKKESTDEMAQELFFPVDYLKILLRELGSSYI